MNIGEIKSLDKVKFLLYNKEKYGNGLYRKYNDRSQNSSKYHKKDGTSIRTKLKLETIIEINLYKKEK